MMQTCRSLYKLGISHRLATYPCPIVISDARTIASFCSFMLAESFSTERFHALRHLTIEPSFSNNGDHLHVASDLVRVFKRASHLELLVITDVKKFFGLWPEIQKVAVNSLPKSRLLFLDNPDNESLQLLKAMTSPLCTLQLHVSGPQRPQTHRNRITLPALPNLATLINLEVEHGIYYSEDEVAYPQLESLFINDGPLPSITHLIRSFPNLTELTFQDLDLQALQLGNRNKINAMKSRWTSLDRLRGDLAFVYSLGLSCPVRRLGIFSGVDTNDLPILLELLDDFGPQALDVTLVCQDLTPLHCIFLESSVLWISWRYQQVITVPNSSFGGFLEKWKMEATAMR